MAANLSLVPRSGKRQSCVGCLRSRKCGKIGSLGCRFDLPDAMDLKFCCPEPSHRRLQDFQGFLATAAIFPAGNEHAIVANGLCFASAIKPFFRFSGRGASFTQ